MIPDSECLRGTEQSLNYFVAESLTSSLKVPEVILATFPIIISSPLTRTPGLIKPSISSLSYSPCFLPDVLPKSGIVKISSYF